MTPIGDGVRIRLASIPLAVGAVLVAFGAWMTFMGSWSCTSTGPISSCQPPPGYYAIPEELIVVGAIGIAIGLALFFVARRRNRQVRASSSAI